MCVLSLLLYSFTFLYILFIVSLDSYALYKF